MSKAAIRKEFLDQLYSFVEEKSEQLDPSHPDKKAFAEALKGNNFFNRKAEEHNSQLDQDASKEEELLLKSIDFLLTENGELLGRSAEYLAFIQSASTSVRGDTKLQAALMTNAFMLSNSLVKNRDPIEEILKTLPVCRDQDQAVGMIFGGIGTRFGRAEGMEGGELFNRVSAMGDEFEGRMGEVSAESFKLLKNLFAKKDFKPEGFAQLLMDFLKCLRMNPRDHRDLIPLLQNRLNEINAEKKPRESASSSSAPEEVVSVSSLMSSLESALTQKGSNTEWQRNELSQLLLLLTKESVNAPSAGGFTPLYFAAKFNDLKSAKALIEIKAEITGPILSAAVSLQGESGEGIVTELLSHNPSADTIKEGAKTAISLGKTTGKTNLLSTILDSSRATISALPGQEREKFFKSLTDEITNYETSKKAGRREVVVRKFVSDFRNSFAAPKGKTTSAPPIPKFFEEEPAKEEVKKEIVAIASSTSNEEESRAEEESSRKFFEEYLVRRKEAAQKLSKEAKEKAYEDLGLLETQSELNAHATDFKPRSGSQVVDPNNQKAKMTGSNKIK